MTCPHRWLHNLNSLFHSPHSMYAGFQSEFLLDSSSRNGKLHSNWNLRTFFQTDFGNPIISLGAEIQFQFVKVYLDYGLHDRFVQLDFGLHNGFCKADSSQHSAFFTIWETLQQPAHLMQPQTQPLQLHTQPMQQHTQCNHLCSRLAELVNLFPLGSYLHNNIILQPRIFFCF